MVWLTGWNYRKSITISNSGSLLTDYQVSITIDTSSLVSSGKLLSNCNDIRFTSSDGSTLVNYWIESGYNTSSTKIWVKIPSVANGANTIYLYYGNPLATLASNGNSTFLVFSDGNDVASWTNAVTNVNGELHFAFVGLSASSKQMSIIRPWTIEYRFRNEATTNQNLYVITGNGTGTSFPSMRNTAGWKNSGFTTWKVGSSTSGPTIYSSMALGTYYIGKHAAVGSKNYNHYLYDDNRNLLGSLLGTTFHYGLGTDPVTDPTTAISFASSVNGYYINTYVTWVFIRNYSSPEPTFSSIGIEEILAMPANITATSMTITPSSTPCIAGSCTVTIDVIWTNTGGTSGSFTPSIKIDTIPVVVSPPLSPVSVGPSLTASQQFIITGLTTGTHNICPDPN